MAPILINRAPWNALIDDSGNNLDGSLWDKAAIKSVLLDPIDVALADVDDGTTKDASQDTAIANNTAAINANTAAIANKGGATIVATTDTGTKNDFVLTGRTKDTVWLWSGNADLVLNGIAAGATGDRLTIKNQSNNSSRIFLPYNAAGSLAANRFYNMVTSAPTPIGFGGWATYVWNGGWTPIDHEQGAPITSPFSAANFYGSGGAWTVTAGQVSQLQYVLRGKTLKLLITIESTNLVTAGQYLVILCQAYGSFLAVGNTLWTAYETIGGTGEIGFAQIHPFYGLDRLAIFRVGLINFPAAVISTYQVAEFPVS